LAAAQACPCGRTDAKGRAVPYAACCGRYLDGDTPAPDAEHLMRSRYTAFVRQRADYLLATWHPAHRPATLDFEPGAKWLGLEVRSHRLPGPTRPRSSSSPATAWAGAPCACTSAAASCASPSMAWRAGCTSMATCSGDVSELK
jgi:hypothetical protein